MNIKLPIIVCVTVLSASTSASAQSIHKTMDDDREIGVLAGLLQPLVGGANLQLEGTYGRFVFDYSHGWGIKAPSVGSLKDQQLANNLPYTTGFGIGYRLTENFDLRFEPKLHKFDVHYDDGGFSSANRVTSYKTVTLGLGAYYRYRPFRGSTSFARGITLAASARLWPNVWSSMDGGSMTYENRMTGRTEELEPSNIGLANTPLIVNLSVGYVFSL